MLSEADFDELVLLDRKDMTRHMLLAAVTAGLGALVIVLSSIPSTPPPVLLPDVPAVSGNLLTSISGLFGKNGLLGQFAGSAIAALSTPPINKYLVVRRNIDRLDLLRGRWRRLVANGDSKDAVAEIRVIIVEAMK